MTPVIRAIAAVHPLATGGIDLFDDPRSAFTTLVVLLVVWYAWVQVTADPDLDRAKRVYRERRAERGDEDRSEDRE